MTPRVSEIVERLEKATGPDRELDGAICLALGWTFQKMKGDKKPYFREPGVTNWFRRSEPPAFTESIDAALTLVPEGRAFRLIYAPSGHFQWRVHLYPDRTVQFEDYAEPALGKTAAIALCIAALRALEAKKEER